MNAASPAGDSDLECYSLLFLGEDLYLSWTIVNINQIMTFLLTSVIVTAVMMVVEVTIAVVAAVLVHLRGRGGGGRDMVGKETQPAVSRRHRSWKQSNRSFSRFRQKKCGILSYHFASFFLP